MVALSGVLFAAIYVLRLVIPEPGAGAGILFMMLVPIALLALEYGVRGGLAGAVVAMALTGLWVVSMDIELGLTGFVTRFATYAISGIGTGFLVEQRQHRDRDIAELMASAELHRQALQVHETVVQQLTVAKLSLEMNDSDQAIKAIGDALTSARRVVAQGVDPGGDLRTT